MCCRVRKQLQSAAIPRLGRGSITESGLGCGLFSFTRTRSRVGTGRGRILRSAAGKATPPSGSRPTLRAAGLERVFSGTSRPGMRAMVLLFWRLSRNSGECGSSARGGGNACFKENFIMLVIGFDGISVSAYCGVDRHGAGPGGPVACAF